MTANDLAARFEEHAPHLRAVAYRMLGSRSEADDAVQEAWLRLSRSDTSDVQNLRGWLTTVVARLCLDVLRSRKARREEPMTARVPEPIVQPSAIPREHRQIRSVSRCSCVLQDVEAIGLPDVELAFAASRSRSERRLRRRSRTPSSSWMNRDATAARQLASRARRRTDQGRSARSVAPISRVPTCDRRRIRVQRMVHDTATSKHSSRCSIPTSCFAPIAPAASDAGAGVDRVAKRCTSPPSAGSNRASLVHIDLPGTRRRRLACRRDLRWRQTDRAARVHHPRRRRSSSWGRAAILR